MEQMPIIAKRTNPQKDNEREAQPGHRQDSNIRIKQKIRGSKKALDAIIEDMKERGYNCGKVVISHCRNAEFAESVKSAIQSVWDKAEVKIVHARGLCSYYAEKGGLIIGF